MGSRGKSAATKESAERAPKIMVERIVGER